MFRLTRRGYSATDAFGGIASGIADNGREVLKALERLKYQITQCANAVPDEQTAKKVAQNASIIDRAMSAVYGVCFDLENLDLVPVYEDDQVQLNGEYGYDLAEEVPPVEDEVEEETQTETEEEEASSAPEGADRPDAETAIEEVQEEEEEEEA